ncbi:hypothetical protein D3C77_614960 [compost metagenome]
MGHQGATQQGFAGLTGREIFETARKQGRDAKLLGQLCAASGIFVLFLNDFRRGAAGVVFVRAEQVGIVALPFIADQLLQLLKGEPYYVAKITVAFAFQ